jgi:hypothetical protein
MADACVKAGISSRGMCETSLTTGLRAAAEKCYLVWWRQNQISAKYEEDVTVKRYNTPANFRLTATRS